MRATFPRSSATRSCCNGALAGRSHLAGDGFTVADLNVASILAWGKMARLDLSAWPDLKRWLDVCLARPANARARALRN
jgi:glutathione S-transferase